MTEVTPIGSARSPTLPGVLTLGSFATALVLLTFMHVSDWDATWRTESAMLILFFTILAAWMCPRWPVLVVAIIAGSAWCGTDLSRESEWWLRLVGYAGRAAITVSLVVWTTRVRRLLERARHLARVDGLTGLPNRQAVLEALDAELCRTTRFRRAFSIAMLDCDGFKEINDRRGHLAGDEVLRHIAIALRQQTRACDCIGRFGGDEFILILSEANTDEVPIIIERLRTALRHELSHEHPDLTYSIGVVTIQAANGRENSPLSLLDCLQRADEAMYAAKREGRDQTRFETFVRGSMIARGHT